MGKNGKFWVIILICLFLLPLLTSHAFADVFAEATGRHAWWFWPLVLFIVTFVMGIFAVLGGVGGGVLFVPIISGFFPFHLDFVRGTGLLVALSGALAAGPGRTQGGQALFSSQDLRCLPGIQHRRDYRLENTSDTFGIGSVHLSRHYGRDVRPGSRVGQCARTQPSYGSPAENQCCNQ